MMTSLGKKDDAAAIVRKALPEDVDVEDVHQHIMAVELKRPSMSSVWFMATFITHLHNFLSKHFFLPRSSGNALLCWAMLSLRWMMAVVFITLFMWFWTSFPTAAQFMRAVHLECVRNFVEKKSFDKNCTSIIHSSAATEAGSENPLMHFTLIAVDDCMCWQKHSHAIWGESRTKNTSFCGPKMINLVIIFVPIPGWKSLMEIFW